MKKIFVLTIGLFLSTSIFNLVSAQQTDAQIRPDLCPAGTHQQNIEDAVSADVACLPNANFDAGRRGATDEIFFCEYERWDYIETTGLFNNPCCPEGYVGNNSGFCCPTSHPNFINVNDGCQDGAGNPWTPSAVTVIFGRNVDTSRGIIDGNGVGKTITQFQAMYPDARLFNSASIDMYWCPTVENYCLRRDDTLVGPSFRWEYSGAGLNALGRKYTSASQTPFNLQPSIGWVDRTSRPVCQKTCSRYNNNVCLPQVGWINRTGTWQTGLNAARIEQNFTNPDGGTTKLMSDASYSDWNNAYSLLCDASGNIKDLLPAGVGRGDAVISGCGRIISYRAPDGSVLFRDPGAFPDLYEEYERCQLCQGTVANPTGNLWSEFGCIEPTASGIVNRIFQIAVGIAGGIIIFRILQAVVKLNLEEPTQEREAEIREIFTSIVVFLIVTLGSVVVLRFLVVNLLGFPLPSLFSF